MTTEFNLMFWLPALAMLASALFVTFVIWLSFRRRTYFLPKDPEERERMLADNRRKMVLIISIVWVAEIFGAVVFTLGLNAQ